MTDDPLGRDGDLRGPIERAIDDALTDGLFTRRQWLVRRLIHEGTAWPLAIEAVASTAMEHPEINYDEERTWEEWEAIDR